MKRLISMLFRPIAAYAQGVLALAAQGHLGFVGLGKETTFGTAVAATDYAEIMSENLSLSIDRFPTRNAFGGFHEPDDYAGMRRIAGDIVAAAHPVTLGHWLKAAMNTVSGSVTLSGFLWTTKFISTKSEFADGVPSQPYTLEVHRDVTSSHRYAGALLNRLALSLSPNQDLRVTGSWLAKAPTLLARSTPTFPGSSTDPFTFDSASLQLGGSANTRFEAFNLSVNNNLVGLPALNNSNEIARIRRAGPQEVRIGGTLDFIDVTEYQDFVNQTERALVLNLFRSQSFNLTISAPRFVYTTFPVGIPGRDRLTIGFEGMARYHTGSGLALDMQLTTIKSNW
jgi:hypothetical protein